MKKSTPLSPFCVEDTELAPAASARPSRTRPPTRPQKNSKHNPPGRTVRECLEKISEAKRDSANEEVRRWLADLIHDRLRSRYIDPLFATPREDKHGFAIMAISCLLIETLECFWLGLPETDKKSKRKNAKGEEVRVTGGFVFNSFFRNRVPSLRELAQSEAEFKAKPKDSFYSHIRCGILHQGETSGRWRIARYGDCPMLDKQNRRINATLFHKEIAKAVFSYRKHLKTIPFTHQDWLYAIQKLEAICRACTNT